MFRSSTNSCSLSVPAFALLLLIGWAAGGITPGSVAVADGETYSQLRGCVECHGIAGVTGAISNANTETQHLADNLRNVIESYYDAIESNQLKLAMAFYHQNSPERAARIISIKQDLQQFLLVTSTSSFIVLEQTSEQVRTVARHKFLRIAGIKFMPKYTSSEYVFQLDGHHWRLWTVSHTPDPKISQAGLN